MTLRKKIKTINKKVEQNKTQYDFDRQTAYTSALSSENFGTFKFLTDKDVLLEID